MLHIQLKGITKCSSIKVNILLADSTPHPLPPDPGVGAKIQLFAEHGHAAYQIKENHECRNMVADILPTDPLTLGKGSVGQNTTFSEHGNAAYQMKENHECSNMVANILPADPHTPSPLGDEVSRSKFNFFQNMVMLHIKLKRITNAET